MTRPAALWHLPERLSSLRQRFVLVVVAALSLPIALTAVLALSSYSDDRGAVDRMLALSARATAGEIESAIAAARLILTTLPDEPRAEARDCRARPVARAIAVLDRSGGVVCGDAAATAGPDTGERGWFDALRRGRDVAIGTSAAHGLVVAVARRRGAAFLGAASVRLDLPAADGGGVIGVVDEAGAIARPPGAPGAVVPDGGEIRRHAAAADGVAFDHTPPGGATLRLAVAPVRGSPMAVAYGGETDALYGPHRRRLAAGLAMPAVVCLTAAAAAWLCLDAMVLRWIGFLKRLASAYARGRYSLRPMRLAQAPAELRSLGRALDEMLGAIASRDAQLRDHVAYRDALIREIHHRVKNNFQIIGSLVSLQSRGVHDPAALAALLVLRGRIDALALVHRVLYEGSNLEVVPLRPFFASLAAQLEELMGPSRRGIRLAIDVAPIDVPADRAVALAMLVTEAVGNAYQHAFPGRRGGTVAVSLGPAGGGGDLVLTIRDDGVGALTGGDRGDSDTLGRSLIHGFARQLGGRAEIDARSGGTTVTVVFPVDFSAQRAPAAAGC